MILVVIQVKTELFECHGHIMMNAENFAAAAALHKNRVDETSLRNNLEVLAGSGVVYFRDAGDNLGASVYAKKIAHEYGIRYVSPAFAIHKEGRYGGLVGRAFNSMSDYQKLITLAKDSGADYIKLMMSGIMTFAAVGELSCPPLSAEEITEIVGVTHSAGLRVMAHVNGSDTIKAALMAGTDSIEHGYFMDDECISLLVQTKAIWVPTIAPVAAFARAGDDKGKIAAEISRDHMRSVGKAFAAGAYVASGSDSGAVGVPHGAGIITECELLRQSSGMDNGSFNKLLYAANTRVRDIFTTY